MSVRDFAHLPCSHPQYLKSVAARGDFLAALAAMGSGAPFSLGTVRLTLCGRASSLGAQRAYPFVAARLPFGPSAPTLL